MTEEITFNISWNAILMIIVGAIFWYALHIYVKLKTGKEKYTKIELVTELSRILSVDATAFALQLGKIFGKIDESVSLTIPEASNHYEEVKELFNDFIKEFETFKYDIVTRFDKLDLLAHTHTNKLISDKKE